MNPVQVSQHPYIATVQRLLSAHGVDTALSEVLAYMGTDGSLDRVRTLFESRGKDARIVQVTVDNLGELPLPALIDMAGQLPCLVRRVGRTRVVIERGETVLRIRRTSLAESMGGTALEVDTPLASKGHFLNRMGQAALTQSRAIVAVILLALLSTAVALAAPALTRNMVDQALPDRADSTLNLIVLALCGVAILRAVTAFLRDRATRGIEVVLSRSLLKDALSRILATPLAKVTEGTLGESLQALSSSEAVLGSSQSLIASTLLDTMTLVSVFGALYVVFPALLPLAMSVTLVTVVIGFLFALQNQRFVRLAMRASEGERMRLHELLSGIFTYKAFGTERAGVARWLGELLNERAASLRKDRQAAWLDVLLDLGQQATLVGAFYWGGQAALAGSLSVGDVVGGLMLLDQLSGACRRTAGSIVPWLGLMPHVSRIQTATCWGEPMRNRAATQESACDIAIRLEDVWFRYGPTEPWLLRGYNLTIKSGEHLHLKGASGAGKTTILRIIAGLYVPERGIVLVNGHNPAQTPDALLYLPQATHLFEGSVADNLRNISGGSRQAVIEAVERTGLVDWLSMLPMHLETVMPPGGTNLSGGQRQWILLTAAVASARNIVLLDEPTSQIDRATRGRLGFDRLFAGKTVIYTAHDL